MRGEGDLFGVKQSGDMTFKIANIKEDMKIHVSCSRLATKLMIKHIKDKKIMYFKNFEICLKFNLLCTQT